MDVVSGLEAQWPPARWQAPNLIQAVIEEEEIFLLPLDVPFMRLLPLQVAPDLAALFRDPDPPTLPDQERRPTKRQQVFEALPVEWPEFSGLDYLGVQEHLVEERDALEQAEDDTDDEEGNIMAPSQHVDVRLSTKRRDSMTDDRRLLQDVINLASPHVATIGLRDSVMPDATAPEFGPILEVIRKNL